MARDSSAQYDDAEHSREACLQPHSSSSRMTDYNNSDLAALAREREARRGGPPPAAAASTPLPKSWASRPAAAPPSNLHSVHRSIKLGRAIGLAATFLSILFLVLGFGWRTVLIVFLGGVGVARGGM